MPRLLLVTAGLLTLPLIGSAQHPPRGGFGGGFRPIGGATLPPVRTLPPPPSMSTLTPLSSSLGGLTGGFVRAGPQGRYHGRPIYGFWPGYGFGYPYYGYGYGYPVEVPVLVEVPVPVYVGQDTPQVELSGRATADLVLQFPAPAEVWINGTKGQGEPQTEWTLTSPILAVGTPYTFEVKARWTAKGKSFEYEKSIDVEGGNRSRSLVLTGREIKE